jgi:hypothetical protein
MNGSIRFAALAATLALSTAAKKPEAPIDPGPQPTEEQLHQAGERAILAGFFDPSSAQFQWDQGIAGGYWKPVLQGKVQGWFTCGLVNGKNRMGGYVGFRRFVVVMNNGRVVYSATGDGGNYDFVSMQCQKAAQQGLFPPPGSNASVAAGSPVLAPDAPRFGFDIAAVPDGAYVSTVIPGTAAAKAGLLQGMVITKMNGVALQGFDRGTTEKILRGTEGELTLSIVGRPDMKMKREVMSPEDLAAYRAAHPVP